MIGWGVVAWMRVHATLRVAFLPQTATIQMAPVLCFVFYILLDTVRIPEQSRQLKGYWICSTWIFWLAPLVSWCWPDSGIHCVNCIVFFFSSNICRFSQSWYFNNLAILASMISKWMIPYVSPLFSLRRSTDHVRLYRSPLSPIYSVWYIQWLKVYRGGWHADVYHPLSMCQSSERLVEPGTGWNSWHSCMIWPSLHKGTSFSPICQFDKASALLTRW